jgi:hypothetical protein
MRRSGKGRRAGRGGCGAGPARPVQLAEQRVALRYEGLADRNSDPRADFEAGSDRRAQPGTGYCARALQRLFDRFCRIDPSRTNADRNHGLGLSIVAAIAKMHGGTVTAESTERGTCISFTVEDLTHGNGQVDAGAKPW